MLVCFAFLTARWDFFSYYFRFIIPLLLVIGIVIAFKNVEKESKTTMSATKRLGMLIQLGLVAGLVGLNVQALRTNSFSSSAIELTFPIRDGVSYVVVACDGVDVVMAHFMQGSISVDVGQSVNPDVVIGRIGKSGNSTQPHLHIHATRGGDSADIFSGDGVPLLFDGRFLVRNDLVFGDN